MSLAEEVLPDLKEFQRRTVEHAFERLYLDPKSKRRFLVADEVGLGKTMIAAGIAAKAIDHIRAEGKVKRIDVIYVCSNQVIARQNISKLRVAGAEHEPVLDRVTMLPAHLSELEKNEVNLIPLTPSTSLDLRSKGGASRERVVLWYLLRELYGEREMRKKGPKRVLQGGCRDVESFEWRLRNEPRWWSQDELDKGLSRGFLDNLEDDRRRNGDASLLAEFEELAAAMKRRRGEHARQAWEWTGRMRQRLAESVIGGLEPDLIILDEFQRFRNLISPDDPTGDLARLLFKQEDARVLMLSATPYKMLTRDVEAEEDHHADFLKTLDFLWDHDGDGTARCERHLVEMRKGLRRLPDGREDVVKSKKSLERVLRGVMSRTERLAVGNDRNGMVEEVPSVGLDLTRADVKNYSALDRVARAIEHSDTIEYWKSSPYPLNFMDDYVLSRDFVKQAKKNPAARLAEGALDHQGVARFDRVDLGNPRLRSLAADTVDRELWKLLWLPPSLPYYRAGKPFDAFTDLQPTKRLVFSAWGVVPKAISLMLSYEAERNLVAMGEHRENTAEARKAVSQPLRISRDENHQPRDMATFALMLPSRALADIGDPLHTVEGGGLSTIRDSLAAIRAELRPRLRDLKREAGGKGADASAWYAAVPLLLEAERVGGDAMIDWLASEEAASVITQRGAEGRSAEAWLRHLERAIEIVDDPASLGKPPRDLERVSALIALGGPGTCALRALSRVAPDASADVSRTQALRVADAMRGLFNWPEIVPLIRATDRTVRYWEDTLRYCINGNLQAVLDEFAHVLSEWAPMPKEATDCDRPAIGVGDAMLEALALHGADYEVRRIDKEGKPEPEPLRMRPRFAIRFADPRASEDRQVDRATNVRASFNSPFWPFVLASTSVGQEGLDFHLYCHAIVHWNLPSNPVDFEQREGRVHRYKGHAVRLNAAHLHGAEAVEGGATDPWSAIFEAAEHGDGDLRPYWVLNEGPARIRRYVPMLPWSRDSARKQGLEKLLASYRLAFGQPRQDDLLAYLGGLDLGDDLVRELTLDLSPPN